MKIEFIWFNLNCPVKINTGVSILSNELFKAGHTVKVLHLNERLKLNFDIENILKTTKKFAPHIIAFSFGSNHFHYVKVLAPILKYHLPGVKIICGSVHSTLKPEEVISEDAVDIVALGEVDGGHLVSFIEKIQEKNDYKSFSNFWIKEDSVIYKNKIRYLPDISNQALPDFDNIDYKRIIKLNRGIYETIASRGCLYNCIFCFNHTIRETYKQYMQNYNPKFYHRKRTAKNVVEEIKTALKKFDIALIQFADDDLSQDKEWFLKFAKLYAKEVNFPYSANFLLNNVDKEITKHIAKSNCLIAKIGIECANEKTRKNFLNKPISNKQIEYSIDCFKRHSINLRNSGLGYHARPKKTLWQH